MTDVPARPRPTGGSSGRTFMAPATWCFVLVALEAVAFLVGLGEANAPMTGGDGPDYNHLAHNLLFHGAYSIASTPPLIQNVTRAPGYPAFLMVVDFLAIHLGIGQVLLVRVFQFAMVFVIAYLVYAVGRYIADESTARIAALLTASYLPLLGLASYHLTEVLTCVLTTLVVLLLLRLTRPTPISTVTLFSVAIAIAALTYVRPEFAPLLIVAVLAVIASDRTGGRLARLCWRPAIVVGVFVLAMAPWVVRNYDLTGRFIGVTADSGASLFTSAEQYSGRLSDAMTSADFNTLLSQLSVINKTVHAASGPRTQVAEDAAYRDAAARVFRRVPLSTVLAAIPKRELYLWQPATFPPSKGATVINALGWAQYLLLIAFGIVGAVVVHRRFGLLRSWPLWVVAVYVSLLHLVFHVEGRYTVEARPTLIVFAAVGVVAFGNALLRRRGTSQLSGALST